MPMAGINRRPYIGCECTQAINGICAACSDDPSGEQLDAASYLVTIAGVTIRPTAPFGTLALNNAYVIDGHEKQVLSCRNDTLLTGSDPCSFANEFYIGTSIARVAISVSLALVDSYGRTGVYSPAIIVTIQTCGFFHENPGYNSAHVFTKRKSTPFECLQVNESFSAIEKPFYDSTDPQLTSVHYDFTSMTVDIESI